jgi:hypothetical protein
MIPVQSRESGLGMTKLPVADTVRRFVTNSSGPVACGRHREVPMIDQQSDDSIDKNQRSPSVKNAMRLRQRKIMRLSR